MAKTFKSVSSVYTIEGNYITRKAGKLSLESFSVVSDSKSNRVNKSRLSKIFDCRVTDIDIDSVTADTITTVFKVHATLDEIIKACESAGIVVDVDIAEDDTNENDEHENA